MRKTNKDPKETLNRYSTMVRMAISDKYIECSKRKNELHKQMLNIHERLVNEKCTLPYQKYVELQEKFKQFERDYNDEVVKIDTWDQAREICIETADEVFGSEFDKFIDIWNSIPEEYPVSKKELERLVNTGS